MAVCLLFGAAAAIGLGTVIPQLPTTSIQDAARGHTDDDLTTGSIIFVPVLGDTCRRKWIDNATWQIRDDGRVDCRTALAQGAHGNQLGASRLSRIRSAFERR